MDGLALTTHIRNVLRDVQSSYALGEFWDDREVRLALNTAQDVFVNTCINSKNYHLLNGIFTNTGYVASATLPTDYLYYASAKIGPTAVTQKVARVYEGGEAYHYRWVQHTAALITNNNYTFIYNGVLSSGTLFYFKRPSYIGLASLGDNINADFLNQDFDSWIYTDLIANHAAVLLAIKEIQTQREMKTIEKMMKEYTIQPKEFANYPLNNEMSEPLLRKMRMYAQANG